MPPIIHCVRHAQGFHNISLENLGIHDPILTPFGEEQCSILSSAFLSHAQVSLIIASPLVRTLQTAILSFQKALSNGKCIPTILALPEAQETSDLISDTGSDIDILKKICEEKRWPVDLSPVHEGWNIKTLPKWAPSRDAIAQRAKEARAVLWDQAQVLQNQGQESPEIVFVTHGGFLHYLTEDWEDSGVDHAYREGRESTIRWDIPGTAWRNTEVRSYTIHPHEIELGHNPRLVETAASRVLRGKTPEKHAMIDTVALGGSMGNFQPPDMNNSVNMRELVY